MAECVMLTAKLYFVSCSPFLFSAAVAAALLNACNLIQECYEVVRFTALDGCCSSQGHVAPHTQHLQPGVFQPQSMSHTAYACMLGNVAQIALPSRQCHTAVDCNLDTQAMSASAACPAMPQTMATTSSKARDTVFISPPPGKK